MGQRELRTLLEGGAFFEGPRWHDGRWWVSDFYRGAVFTVDEDGTETQVLEVPGQPSGLGWLADGSLIVVSMRDHRLLRLAPGGALSTYAELAEYCGGLLNDLVVDEADRVYVGDFGFDLMHGGQPAATSLKRVDPDGTVTVVADELWFPNGTMIDGDTLIVAETTGNRVSAFTLAPDGSLSERRVWAELGPAPVPGSFAEMLPHVVYAPDGCALDADGHVWAADAMGARVCRIAPGGAIVEEIRAPEGLGIFACMLGGADGRTLLMCSAPDFAEDLRKAAREAVLLTTTVDVPHGGRP